MVQREGEEGAVAVRASMDVALPNSAGMKWSGGGVGLTISCGNYRGRVSEGAWLEGSGEETGRRGCGYC